MGRVTVYGGKIARGFETCIKETPTMYPPSLGSEAPLALPLARELRACSQHRLVSRHRER